MTKKASKGYFSKLIFGPNPLPKEAIIFAGAYPRAEIQKILKLFSTVTKLADFLSVPVYIGQHAGKTRLLCFGVYGGTGTLEITNLLADGGVRNIVFIGWAGAQTSATIGSVCLPSTVRALDGIVALDKSSARFVKPSLSLFNSIKQKFPKAIVVTHATLPGFGGLHGISKVTRDSSSADTVDEELSVLLHFASKSKIAAAGIVIVTDSTTEHGSPVNPDVKFTKSGRYKILRGVVENVCDI